MCNRLCWHFSFVHSGKQGSQWKWSHSCTEAINEFSPPCPIWEYPLGWKRVLGSILNSLSLRLSVCVRVCVCDRLSGDPEISPANPRDGKGNRTLLSTLSSSIPSPPFRHWSLFSHLCTLFPFPGSYLLLSPYPTFPSFHRPSVMFR